MRDQMSTAERRWLIFGGTIAAILPALIYSSIYAAIYMFLYPSPRCPDPFLAWSLEWRCWDEDHHRYWNAGIWHELIGAEETALRRYNERQRR